MRILPGRKIRNIYATQINKLGGSLIQRLLPYSCKHINNELSWEDIFHKEVPSNLSGPSQGFPGSHEKKHFRIVIYRIVLYTAFSGYIFSISQYILTRIRSICKNLSWDTDRFCCCLKIREIASDCTNFTKLADAPLASRI